MANESAPLDTQQLHIFKMKTDDGSVNIREILRATLILRWLLEWGTVSMVYCEDCEYSP